MNPRQEGRKMLKYGVVGVMNTLITYFGYIALRHLGLGVDVANALSYVAGMVNGFLMNKLWTFRAHGKGWGREALLFFSGAAVCWGVQWCVFRALLLLLSEYMAQLLGMVVYTVAGYVFNRMVTFRAQTPRQ